MSTATTIRILEFFSFLGFLFFLPLEEGPAVLINVFVLLGFGRTIDTMIFIATVESMSTSPHVKKT